MLAILIALVSAAITGWGSVAQQRVASSVPLENGGTIHLIGQLVRHPLWLIAFGANMVGFATHTWALDVGSLLVVEPVISTTLLFALAFGAIWSCERLPATIWVAALFLVGGLAAFLDFGNPTDAGDDASNLAWLMASLVIVPIVVLVAWWAYRRTGPARAIALGVASGILFGAQASFLKSFTISFGDGLLQEIGNWRLYAVVTCGIAAFVLQQAAFQAGSITLSLPATVVLPPITASFIAIFVMGGTVDVGGWRGFAVAGAVVAMLAGLVVIARQAARLEAARSADAASGATPQPVSP